MLVNKLSVIGYVIIIIIIKREASASLNWREKMCMIPERICHYSNVGCGYSCDFCWEMNTVNGWFSENECFDSVLRLYKISNVRKSNINKCWILIHYKGIWRAVMQLRNSRWYGTFLSTMLLSVLDFYTLIDCKSSHTISEHLFTGDHLNLLALCIFLSDKKISNKSKWEKIRTQNQYRKILVLPHPKLKLLH